MRPTVDGKKPFFLREVLVTQPPARGEQLQQLFVFVDESAELPSYKLQRPEVHHQVGLLQLPQEEHPLLSLLFDGANVQLLFEVLISGGEGLHSVDRGVTQGDGCGWGCILSEIQNHLNYL